MFFFVCTCMPIFRTLCTILITLMYQHSNLLRRPQRFLFQLFDLFGKSGPKCRSLALTHNTRCSTEISGFYRLTRKWCRSLGEQKSNKATKIRTTIIIVFWQTREDQTRALRNYGQDYLRSAVLTIVSSTALTCTRLKSTSLSTNWRNNECKPVTIIIDNSLHW